ncbi:MAG: hypothetical protein Q4G46_10315, partial [Propionibacteriaceae bacterium]|nr:hypothetical protein [Propionibacteriaceae bacterium]
FVLTDPMGPAGVVVQEVLMFVAGLGLVLLAGDTVRMWTASRRAGVVAAVLAGAAPSTAMFALWLYPTIPIAVLVLLAIWGLVRGTLVGRSTAFVMSGLAITGLFLVRATVIWPVAVAWLGILAFLGYRYVAARRRLFVALAVCLAVVGLFTVKNVVLFGAPTQSSWAKENYANVVLNVLTAPEKSALAARNPCFADLVRAGAFQPLEQYPACLDGAAEHGPDRAAAVLDERRWQNGRVNFNHRDRLALSERWGAFVGASLRTFPGVMLRVLAPVQVNGAHDWGSPVLLFGPSTRYVFVRGNVAELGTPGVIWVNLFALLPPIAVAGWLLGLLALLLRREWRQPAGATYLVASGLVALLSGAYLLLEFGENQRFQVEVFGAWLALGVAGVHGALFGRTRAVRGWRAGRDRADAQVR